MTEEKDETKPRVPYIPADAARQFYWLPRIANPGAPTTAELADAIVLWSVVDVTDSSLRP
jgi:hypothetical protein